MLAVGPNGVGKTNLLESLHVATQGFSPRTRQDAQLIRFGQAAARVAVRGRRGTVPVDVEVVLEPGAGKRARLNGAPLRAAEQLRAEAATLVFTPDRLGVVKGAPAARRAYFDRVLGRLTPARAHLPAEYGAAVGQRNASLRRVAGGFSSRDALAPWTEQVATLGAALVASRLETLDLLGPPFAERAGELGLEDAALRYDGAAPTVADLEQRLDRDLDRGVTSLGPHLDDVVLLVRLARAAQLRLPGRATARRARAAARRGGADRRPPGRAAAPPARRRAVGARSRRAGESSPHASRRRGQALVTATDAAMLPAEPDQLLVVEPGDVREAAA